MHSMLGSRAASIGPGAYPQPPAPLPGFR
jgi:hypothetical protein